MFDYRAYKEYLKGVMEINEIVRTHTKEEQARVERERAQREEHLQEVCVSRGGGGGAGGRRRGTRGGGGRGERDERGGGGGGGGGGEGRGGRRRRRRGEEERDERVLVWWNIRGHSRKPLNKGHTYLYLRREDNLPIWVWVTLSFHFLHAAARTGASSQTSLPPQHHYGMSPLSG